MHVRAQVEEECGHSGWYQEGGFIASCTDAADCAKDNSKSTLNLFVSLDRDGSLSFTYTAHGEEFFDFLLFEVNDARVHSTQMWWSSGMSLRRSQYVCVCVCVCLSVYIFLYTYIYIHTHTHTHTGMFLRRFGVLLPAGEHKLSWSWVKDYSVTCLHIPMSWVTCLHIRMPCKRVCTDEHGGHTVSWSQAKDSWASDKNRPLDR